LKPVPTKCTNKK